MRSVDAVKEDRRTTALALDVAQAIYETDKAVSEDDEWRWRTRVTRLKLRMALLDDEWAALVDRAMEVMAEDGADEPACVHCGKATRDGSDVCQPCRRKHGKQEDDPK